MDNKTTEQARRAGSFVSGLLTGWGIPANWARVMAGAIIGAALAALGLFSSGCTVAYSQKAASDGSVTTKYQGSLVPLPVEEQK